MNKESFNLEEHEKMVKSRTAKYDQEIKFRAKKLGINPDNFESETKLLKAVERVEKRNESR